MENLEDEMEIRKELVRNSTSNCTLRCTYVVRTGSRTGRVKESLIKTDSWRRATTTTGCSTNRKWSRQNGYVGGIRYFLGVNISCVFSENFPEDGTDACMFTRAHGHAVNRMLSEYPVTTIQAST